MVVHPIEYKYKSDEMVAIFEQENILQKRLDVEAALARAHAALGNIPKESAEEISKHANTKEVTVARVKEIETEIKHDIMALIKSLAEKCPNAGKYIHLGATSYDIVDTAWALIFRDALKVIEKDLVNLKQVLIKLIKKHKDVVCIGRTHAQHAVPMLFSLKISVWLAEVQRHLDRLNEVRERILVGKMNGAVGTGASFGKKGLELQKIVMDELGLKVPMATTQIIQRDRHVEVVFLLALISATLDKIATEIRNLQRPEIGEVSEAFEAKKQVGSSTMPAKKNPIYCERISGISRVIRGFVSPALENVISWHERDLANSSAERIIFPECFILSDYILRVAGTVLENLEVYPENIKKNLELSKGLCMSEAVMIALTKKGMNRQDAHELIRKCSMKVYSSDKTLKEVLLEDKKVGKILDKKGIEDALNVEKYLGTLKEQVENILKQLG